MTSAEEICEASLKDTKVNGLLKCNVSVCLMGIKANTLVHTGAGSVLRRTRSAKVSGKARGRAEESLVDNRGCKRNSTTLNPKINKVLSDIGSGSLMFSMGSSGNSVFVCFVINKVDANVCCNKNDGSFIKLPSEINTGLDRQSSPVAKSGGPKNSLDHTGIDDVGNTSGDLASSKGGIAIAKTGIVIDKEMKGGNDLHFSLVEDYVTQAWAKYGLERTMMHEGFFMFQFASKTGMEQVLEDGPWFIRIIPIVLNVWIANTRLKKDDIMVAPVWIKMNKVPIVAYFETGLSLITSQLGRPIMLDAYTSC
ncbi:zinc knuckle CX2CX4HX4C containing protein, partial [Tanacetum coccineum]